MVKPKPMSDKDVRITDISVRSALNRVRWNDIPVCRAASSCAADSGGSGVGRGRGLLAIFVVRALGLLHVLQAFRPAVTADLKVCTTYRLMTTAGARCTG